MMTEFPKTQATLLAAIKSPENRRAWDEFIALYRPAIYRMARRRGMQDADAQDVTQDILVRIAGAIGQYEQQPGTKFRHWLRRVAKNAILTALTQTPKDVAAGGTAVAELLAEHADLSPELEQHLATEYRREQYLRAAAIVRPDVNAETWQAFELTVIEGMNCVEAANVIGKSVGVVYASRSRIVKRLREQIELMEREDS
jgi:RNA polymerase sigma-70 factor (ECF subfamily)